MAVYLLGDLHGDFKPIRDFSQYNLNQQTEEDVMILLGDVAANFAFDWRDANFKKKLGKYHMTYFLIRGNHEQRASICAEENPDAWHKELFFANEVWVENEYPYIKYAMDFPQVYVIDHQLTLVVPGAYSVDKYHRLNSGLTWFPQEQLTESEMDYGRHLLREYNNRFDIILSHTCPVFFEPTDLFIGAVDQSLVDKTMERYLSEIENQIAPYKLWAWGHYHQTRVYPMHYKGQSLMLFNDQVFDLTKFLQCGKVEDSLLKIHRTVQERDKI